MHRPKSKVLQILTPFVIILIMTAGNSIAGDVTINIYTGGDKVTIPDGNGKVETRPRLSTIPEMPDATVIESVLKMVKTPDAEKIDMATKNAGIPAALMNFHLATKWHLPMLGTVMHIPVQVSKREGGRPSLWTLKQGQEVLAGIMVTSDEMVLRYVKRETGSSPTASTGDKFTMRFTTRDGRHLLTTTGVFEAVNPRRGLGKITQFKVIDAQPGLDLIAKETEASTAWWVLWSMVAWKHLTL